MNEMKTAKVRITANETGAPLVWVNDVSIPVKNIVVQMGEMGIPVVGLEFETLDIEIELEPAMARSVYGMNAMMIIESLSPREIEEEALTNLSMGDNVVEAIVNTIKQKVFDATQS